MRQDLNPFGRAPQSIEDFLVRIGGRNPYGESNYRACLAQYRFIKAGETWNDWDEALETNERGGLTFNEELMAMAPSGNKPIRVVAEMRDIPRYPVCDCDHVMVRGKNWDAAFPSENLVPAEAGDCQVCQGVRGWIVEKWVPAHKFKMSEAEWYQHKVPGFDIPRLGPYPHQGEYMRVPNSHATARIPPLGQLGELIFYLESHRSKADMSDDVYRRQREDAILKERERIKMAHLMRNKDLIRRSLEPLLGNSLRAGIEREKYANRLRARGHAIGHVGN